MTITDEQKKEIRNCAVETVYADVTLGGLGKYLYSIIEQWVDSHETPLEQAKLVTSDENIWPDVLPLNPRTGQPWPEKD
jgi:hypothetical protein